MNNQKLFLLIILFLTGCGGEKKEASKPEPVSQTAAQKPGNISCSVAFEGIPPKMSAIKMSADKKCVGMHAEPVMFQSVIINDKGMLKNVFVYIKEGITGRTSPPKQVSVIDQKGCMYEPHVMGMQVGQPLRIQNNDPLLHNIHALTKINKAFNFAQPKKGMSTETTFTEPEVMVKVKCDVHPWMGCYIGVLEHPFFAVTNSEGTCDIKGLPAGDYILSAWHEEFGTLEQKVKISSEETASVEFKFVGR